MKNYKKAFSFIELFLIVALLGIIVAIFLPASMKIRTQARKEAISINIEQIVLAGAKYNTDKATSSVDFKTLIDEKYIEQPTPVAGESYDNIEVESIGGVIVLKTQLDEIIEIPYNF